MFFSGFIGVAKRLDSILIDNQIEARKAKRRKLTDQDVYEFMQSADQRRKPMSDEELMTALNFVNAHRLWRVKRDYQWMRKELIKMGIDPERARNLL